MNVPPRRVALWFFAAALVARLLFLAAFTDRGFPFSAFYYGDSRLFREFALALLRGETFDGGIPFHPPGFAWALAAVIAAVGERPGAVRAVLAGSAATVVPLVYLLGRRVVAEAPARLAAVLCLFSFALSVLAVSPNAETVYLPLLLGQALAAMAVLDAYDHGRRRTALAWVGISGVLLGLGSLVRAEHLGLGLFLPMAWALGTPRLPPRRLALATGGALAVAALVLAPWVAHSHRALTRFNRDHPGLSRPLPTLVAVSTYGPLNFALANHPGADGTFRPGALTDRLDLTDPAQLGLYLDGYKRGVAFMAEQPLAATVLVVRKLRWAAGAFSLGFGAGNWPPGLAGTRRPVDLFVPDGTWWMVVLLAPAAWGLWTERRRWRAWTVVGALMLHKVAVVVAFFGYARLFAHLLPFVLLLAAVGLCAVRAGHRSRRIALVLGIVLAGLLTAELGIRALRPTDLVVTGSVDPVTGKIVQDAELRIQPRL